MKRKDWADLSANAPPLWAEKTTGDKYKTGLERVMPPGGTVDPKLVSNYEKYTGDAESKRWLSNWAWRVFGVKV